MTEYLKHEDTAEPLDIESEKARLRNFKGDYPETDLPRYQPGDKILGSLPYKRPVEQGGPVFYIQGQSAHTDTLSKIVDITWRSMQAQYEGQADQGLEEYPRVEKIGVLLAIANNAVKTIYPNIQPLILDQILLMDRAGMNNVIRETEDRTPTQTKLEKLGWNPGEPKNDFFRTGEDTNRLLFLNDNYSNIDNDEEPWLKIAPECAMVYNMILGNLEQAKVRRFVPYNNEVRRIFSRVLDNDARTIPKAHPELDIQGFKDLVKQYRNLLDNGSNILVHTYGGIVSLATKINPEDYTSYQTIMATGVSFDSGVDHYLGRAPLKLALDEIVKLYPPDFRDAARKSANWYFKENEDLSRGIGPTLQSYGIKTEQETLAVLSNDSILEKYVETKKKRKNIEYPL